MDIVAIVNSLNDGSTMENESSNLGISRRTLQRRLKENGYIYNRDTKKYINLNCDKEENLQIKIEDNVIENNINNVSVNRTYSIDEDNYKALRFKSAVEVKDMSTIVNEALRNYIEQKYYNINI